MYLKLGSKVESLTCKRGRDGRQIKGPDTGSVICVYDIIFLIIFCMSRWNGALHKLLEIFQKVTRDFTKSCSKIAQETTKVAFSNETCSKVARKTKHFLI